MVLQNKVRMSASQQCLIDLHREMGHALKSMHNVVFFLKHLKAPTRLWRRMIDETQFIT